jgi:hypothetical protein
MSGTWMIPGLALELNFQFFPSGVGTLHPT